MFAFPIASPDDEQFEGGGDLEVSGGAAGANESSIFDAVTPPTSLR